MQTTLEVDDDMFSKLNLGEKGELSEDVLRLSPPQFNSQIMAIDQLSSASSSAGRTSDSDSLQPPASAMFQDAVVEQQHQQSPLPLLPVADSPNLPSTLAHKAGDYVLLLGSCNLNGRYGVPVGLNLTTGLTGAFCLASAKRIPKSCAWTTHRSVRQRYSISDLSIGFVSIQ